MSKHDSFHGAPYDNDDSSRDIYSNSRSSQSSSGRRPPNRKKGKTKKNPYPRLAGDSGPVDCDRRSGGFVYQLPIGTAQNAG